MSERYEITYKPGRSLMLNRQGVKVAVRDLDTGEYVLLEDWHRTHEKALRAARHAITEWEREYSKVAAV